MKHLKTFNQLNESVKNSDEIPVLGENATWEEIEAYLQWLNNSAFEYHIDDDPEDIIGFDDKAKEVLRHNANIMWGYNERPDTNDISDEKMMHMLWDAYKPDGVNEAEKKPKPMSEMTKAEKIATYRKKISDERKKAAPDLTKIDGWNEKIADIEAKAKKKQESKKK